MNLRKSVFSGSWYPVGNRACEEQIHQFLEEGKNWSVSVANPVGGIVPHAGWTFSGSIACNVIHRLAQAESPDVVVVFGMHQHTNSPRYIMSEGEWETPFGPIAVDTALAGELTRQHSFQLETPTRFQQDNTIELQMPFIRYFFKDARVVAMGVPPTAETLTLARSVVETARVLDLSIVVIGSTDLTHYGPNYGFTSKGFGQKAVDWVRDENDRRVIDAMIRMDPEAVIHEGLNNDNACCCGAAAAAIVAGKAMGARKADKLVYATSYDKSPGDSFVGYVGVLF
ncbi:MAG: AmmeMemoRadiSam system protein B [Desulfosarcina sp.]|nr:AmmeMemoRadiSam system protein B [Desulfosarcina sp.]MBC2743234.1 AmmeMemoRadiSam system protein B [Desulfosarcina sp.]MBC2766145.1 AmmeMemoRadiSam system protein B [Desulfosarcina sp.]